MLLLALALAPGIAIMIYIYLKDRYNKEPIKNLAISFLLGVLSTIPAIIVSLALTAVLKKYLPETSVLYNLLLAFAVVGFSEEGSKFFMLRFYAFRKKAFDEPLDGIIYSVIVSMGFATLENVLYVTEHGFATAILRMFLSVPAHAAFGVLMGYHVGLARFDPSKRVSHLWKGLLLAVFFHGSFDFFLFLQESKEVTRYVSAGLLIMGALVSYFFAVRIALRSIKMHQELSRIQASQQNDIT